MKVQVLTFTGAVDSAFYAPSRDQDGPWLPVKRDGFFSPGLHHPGKPQSHYAITIPEEESALCMPDRYDARQTGEALHLYAKGRRGGVVLHSAPRKGVRIDTWA